MRTRKNPTPLTIPKKKQKFGPPWVHATSPHRVARMYETFF